jgi:hypothetical protein
MPYDRRVLGSREARQLRDKYVEMLAMRLAHASGHEEATDVRARMVALAARFPGALREIDDLDLVELRGRIAKLEGVLAGALPTEPWMEAVSLFHTMTRGALSAKRWLSGRKRADASVEGAYAVHVAGLEDSDDARAWMGELAAIARPPGGRLTALVYARIGRILGTSESQARHLVFGASSARSGRGRHGRGRSGGL